MKTPKLGKWISAAKVRLVKKNGVKVLEIRRTVKKKTVKNTSRQEKQKGREAGSGLRLEQDCRLAQETFEYRGVEKQRFDNDFRLPSPWKLLKEAVLSGQIETASPRAIGVNQLWR